MFSTICRIEEKLCCFNDLNKLNYLKKIKIGLLAFYFTALLFIALDVINVF